MNASTTVRHRNIYYFSGFDPRGSAHYLRLFKRESCKGNIRCINSPSTKKIKSSEPLFLGWETICSTPSGDTAASASEIVHVNHYFMRWDDIIRAQWKRTPWSLLIDCILVYARGISKISLGTVWRIHHGAFWAGILPGICAIAILAITSCAFFMTCRLSEAILYSGAQHSAETPVLPLLFAMMAAWMMLKIAASLSEKSGIQWLLKIFRFNLLFASRQLPELEIRQQEWTEAILKQQQECPSEEVVLIGHSVGTIVMMDVAYQLMNDPQWMSLQGTTSTKLLTLGNCLPFITLNREAEHFRKTLEFLCRQEKILWWDVTAKIDPLCFYKTHPLAHTAFNHLEYSRPALHAARFFKMYPSDRWRRIRQKKLLTHFLYLMNPEIDHGFNLYRLIHSTKRLENYMDNLAHAKQ